MSQHLSDTDSTVLMKCPTVTSVYELCLTKRTTDQMRFDDCEVLKCEHTHL